MLVNVAAYVISGLVCVCVGGVYAPDTTILYFIILIIHNFC